MKCKICGIMAFGTGRYAGGWIWRTVCDDYPVCHMCEWWFSRTVYTLIMKAKQRC